MGLVLLGLCGWYLERENSEEVLEAELGPGFAFYFVQFGVLFEDSVYKQYTV